MREVGGELAERGELFGLLLHAGDLADAVKQDGDAALAHGGDGEEQSGEATFKIADPIRDEELNLKARAAAELLLGREIIAALDLLNSQHEVGEAVARPGRQHLRCEQRRLVDAAGIHAQPEGGVEQLRIVRRLGERQVDLVGRGIVVVILFGHARGEIAAVERDQGDLRAALRLRLGRWRGAALLGVADRGESEEKRCRKQREGFASHIAHMLG